MRYQILSKEAVKIFKEVQEFDRPDWKLKNITRAQAGFLVNYIELSDLLEIDRGTASLLTTCMFKVLEQGVETTDANILGELYKLIKAV